MPFEAFFTNKKVGVIGDFFFTKFDKFWCSIKPEKINNTIPIPRQKYFRHTIRLLICELLPVQPISVTVLF